MWDFADSPMLIPHSTYRYMRQIRPYHISWWFFVIWKVVILPRHYKALSEILESRDVNTPHIAATVTMISSTRPTICARTQYMWHPQWLWHLRRVCLSTRRGISVAKMVSPRQTNCSATESLPDIISCLSPINALDDPPFSLRPLQQQRPTARARDTLSEPFLSSHFT